MTTYLIYRHGSNAANQPMTPEPVPVAIVDAETPEEAKRLAAEEVTVYANQFLSAVTQEDCDSEDWNHVLEQRALEAAYESEVEPLDRT